MKDKIILSIKESYAGIFISLCMSFMLLFYEPLNLFASNLEEFWFDIYSFFPIVLFQSIIAFFVLSLFFILIKKINKNLYAFFVVLFFIILICSYIQGNYLTYNLPSINGSIISFEDYNTDKMISSLLWKIVILLVLFLVFKFKYNNLEKKFAYVSLAIILMLSASMISFFVKPVFFDKKNSIVATNKNLNNKSSDTNFIIFLIDAADSSQFSKEVKKLGKTESLFKDFTYYPDTLAAYPFTRNSIPFIFSGQWYENETSFSKYFTKSFDESPLIGELEKNNYALSLYEYNLNSYNSDNYKKYNNIDQVNNFNYFQLFKEEAKLILYKYLPYQLKDCSHINTSNMSVTKSNDDLYTGDNLDFYKILDNNVNIIEEKNFQFIHIIGAHLPFKYDINLNVIENGKYKNILDASITVLEKFLNQLKENNVYNNSVIVIMADHGYGKTIRDRSNPILYIKGKNEKHSYRVSEKKVSFVDLIPAFKQLINGDKTDKIFNEVNGQERRYLLYEYTNPDILIEEIQKGNAWNEDTIVESGKKFISG